MRRPWEPLEPALPVSPLQANTERTRARGKMWEQRRHECWSRTSHRELVLQRETWVPRAALTNFTLALSPPHDIQGHPPRVLPGGGTCEPLASPWSLIRSDPATGSTLVTHSLDNGVS